MKVLWEDIEVQSTVQPALDFFYGVRQVVESTKTLPQEFLVGNDEVASDGLHISRQGCSTTLKSGCSARVKVESDAAASSGTLPDALAAAATQQWLRNGFLPLHAALFDFEDCGLLVLGDSTSGKSTLTLAARSVGARVVSDDFIRVKLDSNGQLVGMRIRAFLRERHLSGDRLHWLAPYPTEFAISAIAALQAVSERTALNCYEDYSALSLYLELVRQSAPLFMHGFAQEAATMHRIISALTCLPRIKVKTGTEVKNAPLAALQGILRALRV